LVATPVGHAIARRIAADTPDLHFPHLAVVETLAVLRRWVQQNRIDSGRAAQALDDLSSLSAVRHPHEPYLRRAWMLRENVSPYDAVYVALAETLGANLITCDRRLAGAPQMSVTIELIEAPSR
jgi:predicted nucleic acid-binding protein